MTSGNPILDKNLECIAKYNPELKEKLLNLKCLTNTIELVETKRQEPNLTYNGVYLHSQDGAEIEAKTKFDNVKNSTKTMHIVFGIGIGHLFKECTERSRGKVFLLEPNLEILRVTLELVDLSKEFSRENVFVASDIEVFKKLYNQNYMYKAESEFLILNSYKNALYKNELDDIVKRLEIIVGSCFMNLKGILIKGYEAFLTVIKNISYTLEATPLGEYKNIYKGKTALIISAGPSLDFNIDTIKNNQDKFIIFCVGPALKTLQSNNIHPDFVNIIENMDCSGQILGADLSDINLITEPFTHNSVYLLKVKQNFLFPTNTYDGNNYWAKLTDVDISEYVVKGTVAYSALASAKMLGFSKIILVGQDLAYLNNQCYSSKSAYSDMIVEINPQTSKPELKLKDKERFINAFASANPNTPREEIVQTAINVFERTKDNLYAVKGIKGDILPTNKGYATFIEMLSEFAYNNQDIELINTSMVGAQINGFKNISLDEALMDAKIVEKAEFSKSFKYDKAKISQKLEQDVEILTTILTEIGDSELYIFDYEDELRVNGVLTSNAYQAFKQLLTLYSNIDKKYRSNLLYSIIVINESLEINSRLEELSHFDEIELNNYYNLLKNYFKNLRARLIAVISEIQEQIIIIK